MATVDFGGVRKEVCLAYVPDVQVGDYTIVHVGLALTKLDEASALESPSCSRASDCSTRNSASRWTRCEVSRRVR